MKYVLQLPCSLVFKSRKGRRGSALLITLAFVILLTVLIVGFLSRTLLEQRISASSANQVKSDLFAQGVEATIIGNLEQEIINGSNTPITAGSSTIYTPKAPANMVPVYDYPSCPTGGTGPVAGLANLLKVSTTSPVTGSTFPAAAAALTTNASLNGRSVSQARWLEAQLIDPSATLPTPNWIMVARDGSNPTTFSNSGANDVTYQAANKANAKTVIGRYAYAIYDEGGLLDMNVAGYPTTTSPTPASILTQASYRNGQATADLSQLTASGSPLLSSAQIDTLIGWRNNASVSPPAPTGTVSAPANLTTSNATNYFSFVQNNTTGALSTGNSSVYNSGTTYSTDQAFTSRFQLIQFMQSLLGTANGNTALQYMTHFSRSLNQPSYIPPVNDPSISPAPPITKALASPPDSSSNTAQGADAAINPSFLSVTVGTAFTRNDGSAANVGDPLVKKRFNLNRLAWVTYAGPIWNGSSYSVPTSYINALKTTYGFTDTFLKQGTAANVYNYFGLSWVQDTRTLPGGDSQYKWLYSHNNTNAAGPVALGSGTAGITRLSSVTGREPDFFELLKAGVTAGSKAKAATTENNPNNIAAYTSSPDYYQNTVDISLDYAIIQLGANIIDQFDLDGFPTRILFDDGGIHGSLIYDREICGVENLPYFYRIRASAVVGRLPTPLDSPVGTYANSAANAITDPGYAVYMEFPEIWNPYDSNSPRCATDPATGKYMLDSSGNPLFPTSFRLVVDSTDPDHLISLGSSYASVQTSGNYYSVEGYSFYNDTPYGYQHNYQADTTAPTWAKYTAGTAPFTSAIQLTCPPFYHYSENSGISFQINEYSTPSQANFFREPTMLCAYNTPIGSMVQAYGAANILSGGTPPPNHAPLSSILTTGGAVPCIDGNNWLGIYLGTIPIDFYIPDPSPSPHTTPAPSCYANNWGSDGGSNHALTVRMQYNTSPGGNPVANWVSYDTKYTNVLVTHDNVFNLTSTPKSPAKAYSPLHDMYYNVAYDPRTSRFSMPFGGSWDSTTGSLFDNGNTPTAPGSPPYYGYTLPASTFGWLDFSNRVLISERPDYSNGYFMEYYSTPNEHGPNLYPTTLPGTGGDSYASVAGTIYTPPDWVLGRNEVGANSLLHFGMLAQNDPNFTMNGKVVATSVGGLSNYPVPMAGTDGSNLPTSGQYYADPDGIVRRGMAAYMTSGSNVGQPLAVAYPSGTNSSPVSQIQSRPIILNRPFKAVAELGYVFSGTPWKNIDFFTPESGDSALLDLFTVADTNDINGLIAGKVNLNTQQIPVLQAILAGAYKDEQNNYSSPPSWAIASMTGSTTGSTTVEAYKIAKALTTRTLSTNPTSGQGPLRNISELVGRYISKVNPSGDSNNYDGSKSYSGFSGDALLGAAFADTSSPKIQRMRESAVRALSAAGQTRVWNLMIDVVAQTGRYPGTAASFDQFAVEGEQRYWIHLAIDRLTGQIIDKQIEVAKE